MRSRYSPVTNAPHSGTLEPLRPSTSRVGHSGALPRLQRTTTTNPAGGAPPDPPRPPPRVQGGARGSDSRSATSDAPPTPKRIRKTLSSRGESLQRLRPTRASPVSSPRQGLSSLILFVRPTLRITRPPGGAALSALCKRRDDEVGRVHERVPTCCSLGLLTSIAILRLARPCAERANGDDHPDNQANN